MTIPRSIRSTTLFLSTMALALAACADGPTEADRAPALTATAPATLSVGDTTVTTFEYNYRNGTTQALGNHKIVMPALSVCARDSGYGPGEWDKPCAPAMTNITITAKQWLDKAGHPQIHFGQHLRFVPTTNDREFVKLFLRDKDASDATLAAQLRIDWVPHPNATAIDEYATDPTLRTHVNEKSGVVWRRIKHFSGYMVASGREGGSTPTTDGEM